MQVLRSAADGYCFLNSVIACLSNDYGDNITRDEIFPKLVSHLCDRYGDYVNVHTFEYSPLPPPDTLITDALTFFRTGNFNTNIVDLLMQITADALKLNLFIYQRNEGNIQVLRFHHPDSQRIVRCKFTHNNKASGGNHYDAIICRNTRYSGLDLLTEVAAQQEKVDMHENVPGVNKTGKHTQQCSPTLDNIPTSSPEMFSEYVPNFRPYQSPPKYSTIFPESPVVDLTGDDDTDPTIKEESQYHSDTTYHSTDVESNSSCGFMSGQPGHYCHFPPPPRQFTSSSDATRTSSAETGPENEQIFNYDLPSDLDFEIDMEAEITDEEQMNILLKHISRGKPFPTWYFHPRKASVVKSVPDDIDGIAYYKIKASEQEWQCLTRDKRHFTMMTSQSCRFQRRTTYWYLPRLLCMPLC